MNWMQRIPKPILILGWILVVTLCFMGLKNTDNGYQKEIRQIVQKKGGEVVTIDLRSWNIGPFKMRAKHERIYRVTYKLNGVEKKVWVKKGSWGKDKWIWV